MYKELAEKYYKGKSNFRKALSAGIALDNALKLDYTKGGSTNCHFMIDNYLKYFTYEKLNYENKN